MLADKDRVLVFVDSALVILYSMLVFAGKNSSYEVKIDRNIVNIGACGDRWG